MKRDYLFYLILVSILFTKCKSINDNIIIPQQLNNSLTKQSKISLKNWHFKDIIRDTIPGISLDRAYNELLLNKIGKEIIVAVIDMEIDINHEYLKDKIWLNKNEISNNNIDDDKNGYVDDIHGWNFLGNPNGENNIFVNYEYTRIIKKYDSEFKDKRINEISNKDSLAFTIYKSAIEYYNQRMNFAKEDVEYAKMIFKSVFESKKALSVYFKDDNYTIKDLDSLKQLHLGNEELQSYIKKRSGFIKHGYTEEYVTDYKLKADERINKLLNLEFNDRFIQGDDIDNIDDIKYGNNIIDANLGIFDHGTKMAGIISSIGFKNEIKIMPLPISAYGDEHDKDIALAIKYAVDNGAKVINMSFAKEFSLHPKWVTNAFLYAEKNNVIIVNSASNDGVDLDQKSNYAFPNDHGYYTNSEVSKNFIKVGAIGNSLDKTFKPFFSNYGKEEVDIFAPGKNIYTTLPYNKYTNFAGGTSSASAITSGLAALIFSYYPNLSSQEVKKIIMDSGIEYNIDIKIRPKGKSTPFNQLSKSGKVINAYNALILASQF